MVGVAECIVCNYPYDLGVHEPMSLSCGHSVCRHCWTEWQERKGGICPSDRQPVTSAVNYGLREMLQQGTPCDKHPTERLEYVCPDDETACCARCIILDHHGHHRPLQLDFSTVRPMFEAALAETERRLSAVETIESQAQRICADAGELVRVIVGRRDELLRNVLPGYMGGLPWSFGQQPIQQLNTTEVRMYYERLKQFVQAETEPAAAFRVYRELKEALDRCLPHIPAMLQSEYDQGGLDSLHVAIHSWGINSTRPQQQQPPQPRLVPSPQFPSISGLAIAPRPSVLPTGASFLSNPPLDTLGSVDSLHSPSLFSMSSFVAPHSPNPRSALSMPSPLQIEGTSSMPGLNGWGPTTAAIPHASSESSISSPTDSPHRTMTSAMSELSVSSTASPAPPTSLAESTLNGMNLSSTSQYSTVTSSTPSRVTTPGPATQQQPKVPQNVQLVQQASPSATPSQPTSAVVAGTPGQQAAVIEDTEPGEEFRGIVACLLNDTHDEGFCEVRGPNRQAWNVYFNLHGGKVATVNVSGFDPAILEAGYEVFVKLTDNPDQTRASQDSARRYVARSMRLGMPPKPVRGVVNSVWNDGQDGFAQVESPDGHTQYRVYFRFGLGGTFKTGHDPKTLVPSKLKPGTAVHVTLMENPQKDKARGDVTRKYVARSIKMIT